MRRLTDWRTTRILCIAIVAALAAAHPRAAVAAQASAHAATAQPATPVETVTAFHAALADGDTSAALDLLAEDVLIFESGNVESSRAEYASHHLAADAAFSAAVGRTLISRSQSEDGDNARVLSVERVAGTFRDRAIDSRSVETMLLRRVAGQWRIVHIHWSSTNL